MVKLINNLLVQPIKELKIIMTHDYDLCNIFLHRLNLYVVSEACLIIMSDHLFFVAN